MSYKYIEQTLSSGSLWSSVSHQSTSLLKRFVTQKILALTLKRKKKGLHLFRLMEFKNLLREILKSAGRLSKKNKGRRLDWSKNETFQKNWTFQKNAPGKKENILWKGKFWFLKAKSLFPTMTHGPALATANEEKVVWTIVVGGCFFFGSIKKNCGGWVGGEEQTCPQILF